MTCEVLLNDYFATLMQGFHCSLDADGRLAVVTPYLYPDHDFIEIFVRDKGDTVVVSDLGQTLRQLDTLGLDVCHTPRLNYAAKRIAIGLGVAIESGTLVKRGPSSETGRLFFDVISAAKLVSALAFGNRSYEPIGFDEEVKSFFASNAIEAVPKDNVTGFSGTKYEVSFKIKRLSGDVLVETVSPRSKGGIKNKVNSAFRMWSDIDRAGLYHGKRFSLLNDDPLTYSHEDVVLLSTVSRVRRWSERDAFATDLKAIA
jgi:Domain of unknown function DUF1828